MSSTAPTLTFRASTGSTVRGQAYTVSSRGELLPVRAVHVMPGGYDSVVEMLSTTPFLVAHHGGSLNWPEMSLYAYTQSVYYGAGALEISLARSSDGVWFGLHDESLDRTSGTRHVVAAEHSWADIQRYAISAAGTADPAQPARAYMRWEELVRAYYPSHVLFVDPKYATPYLDELLVMLDALPDEPTRHIIAKDAGGATTWPDRARARGYTTWGYYYERDVATLHDTQGSFDVLGMDYRASATAWAAARSFGKPVIAHVVPSIDAARRALHLGADGIMASDIRRLGVELARPH